MKKNNTLRRISALLLAVMMCVSMLPLSVFAAEDASYTKISTMDELTTGQYVMVASNGYAPAQLDGTWILAADFTPLTGDTITDAQGAVWTLTVDGTTVKLTDANGVSIAPKSGNTNGIQSRDYSWAVACTDGAFTFSGQGSDTTILASNVGSENKFRAYKTTTVSGNPNGYPSTFTLYKLAEDSNDGEEETTAPPETTTPSETATPEETTAPVVTVVDIATALAASEGEFTVKGVVTLVDGLNYYVQDATGGICVRLTDARSDIALGDTIIGTGTRAVYNGLPQLGSATVGKSEGLALSAKGTTIGALTTADICTYVTIKDLEVTAVSETTITVTDGTNTIQIYKAVTGDTPVAVGGKVDFTGAVGVYKETLQLRNTLASELVVTPAETEPTDPSEPDTPAGSTASLVTDASTLKAGDQIIIVASESAYALSTNQKTNNRGQAEVTKSEDGATVTYGEETQIITLEAGLTEGTFAFNVGSGYLYAASSSGNYLKTETTLSANSSWSVEIADGIAIVKAAGENSRNWLRHNVNSSLFACYGSGSGQKDISIYKLGGVEEEPEVPAWNDVDKKYSIYEQVAELKNGDVVVLYNPGNGKALSSADSSYYKAGVDATVTENYIASDADYIEWTVSVTEENGVKTYTFTQGEHTLGIEKTESNGKTYFNLQTASGDTGWTLQETAEGSGLYYLYSSTLTGQYGNVYLEWYASKSAFSAYCTGASRLTEKDFGFGFYKLVREGVEEEQPEPTVSIADGDYVIWAPAYNKALSSVYGGYYNNGVDVTLDGEKLTGYSATEIWTVKNNEDGTISVSFGGQNLAMAASYTSMTLGEANDEWILEDAGNGTWYVKNVAREAYMQWYADKNYWSAYYSIAEGSEGKFALQFTPAEAAAEPADGIADGDYVIWAPAYNMALSTVYGSYYNNGVAVTETDDVLSGYSNTEVWTVTNNEDGTITISCAGGKLAMGTSYSSMPLNEVNDTWILEDAGDGLWYVKNAGRGAYIEWYASNKYWSGYRTIGSGSEGMFALKFTPVEKGHETDASIVKAIAQWGGMTKSGNTAFVYGDKYHSGDEKDTEDKFTAVVSGSTVTPWIQGGSNEAPLYYMGGMGIGSGSNDYMQLAVNAAGWGDMELSFRLRASNSGPGSFQLKYSTDGGTSWRNFTTGSYAYAYSAWNSEGSYPVTGEGAIADGVAKTSHAPANYVSFTFDVPAGADNCGELLIRLVPGTEKAKGDGPINNQGTVRIDQVVLSGSPIVADSVTGVVSVEPDGTEDQPAGTALTMTSSTGGATIYYRVNGGEWKTYDPENKPTLDTLPCDVEAYAASEGKADSVVMLYHYAAGSVEAVKITPNGGGIYIGGESAEITLSTDTEGATIWYATSADGVTFTEFAEYTAPIVVKKGFGQLSVSAYATKDGYKDTEIITRDFKERLSAYYNIYFGQLHSHTNISDGAGSVEEAFQYASNVKNLDFLAVTDHSNSFDGEGSGVLSEDGSTISSEWAQGHAAAQAVTDENFVGLYGFEMTWSGGAPGHINTFNTPGWQSRTQAAYKDKSRNALQSYYDTLATVPDSISQFNHPGTTFGDFYDFDCYSETSDALITLIEVGNGEGAIGSSGYFPSYEYYTRALDKGWHVAPTNNQDNHKGMWGDSNTGRSVILADSLTEADIYDALRNYRVYATEDNDLNIYYTLNGAIMGSQLYSTDVEDTVSLTVKLSDVTDSANAKVEVIVNGGRSLASKTASCNETVTFGVSSAYNYYYIRVTQADGDIAVTAPVWIGQVEAVGISSLEAASELTIAGEEQTFTMEMFNNERKDLEVRSVVFTDKDTGEVIHTDNTITKVESEGTASCTFGHTFETDGIYTITATVQAVLNGLEKTYTQDLELTVMPEEITSRVIVDGSHNNDYVSGYYAGNMGNMTSIAAAEGIQVHVETEEITPEMLEKCSLLVISAPNTRTGESYPLTVFEDEFIELVAEYVKNGGNVIICGLADYQDKKNDGIHETSVQLNKLLEAMGSTMRINDDEAYDEERNGGQAYRLYPESFNMDSEWCEGIQEGQTYSQYSGCTVDVGSGTWLVKGFDSTYSIDSDKDGKGGVAKGEAYFLAAEDTPYGGTIFAAGGVFLSDFEVKAELDNIWDLPYANRTIYENILGITRKQPVITPIADVRASAKAGLGEIFVIEGYVTAGTANENTKFFDAIYLQDASGGITVFPYSELGLELGTKMRVTGYTDAYQGDIEIQIINYQILDGEKNVIAPEKMSAGDAMNYDENGGELIQVQGEVISAQYTTDSKGVAQFVIRETGTAREANEAKIFIDGYILSGTTGENTLADIVQVGNTVSAVGLLYMHPEGDSTESVAVLRVRDCDEVVLIKEAYRITSGGEATVDEDTASHTIGSNGSKDAFTGVELDGKTVDSKYYTVTETEEGGILVTFTKEFLKTLTAGEHTVTLVFADGEASTTLTVEKEETSKPTTEPTEDPTEEPTTKPTEDPTEEPTTKPTEKPTKPTTKPTTKPSSGSNADTSDSSMIVDAMLLMAAALIAMAVLLANRKRWFGR